MTYVRQALPYSQLAANMLAAMHCEREREREVDISPSEAVFSTMMARGLLWADTNTDMSLSLSLSTGEAVTCGRLPGEEGMSSPRKGFPEKNLPREVPFGLVTCAVGSRWLFRESL